MENREIITKDVIRKNIIETIEYKMLDCNPGLITKKPEKAIEILFKMAWAQVARGERCSFISLNKLLLAVNFILAIRFPNTEFLDLPDLEIIYQLLLDKS